MKSLPDTRPYFFLHQSKEGYTVAIQKGIGVYFVVIMDDEGELMNIPTYGQEKVQYLYETLYQWLAYCPGDVPRKCLKLRDAEDLPLAFQLLPLAEVSVTIPDLKQMEFEEFKQKMKK